MKKNNSKRFILPMILLAFLSLGFFGFSNTVSADITTGLVSHWTFDEGSGTTAGDSAGTNDGSISGGATWVAGQVGQALSFAGNDGYVDVAYSAELGIVNNFTVSMWLNDNDSTNKDRQLEKGNSFFILDSIASAGCVAPGKWQFLVKNSGVNNCVEDTSYHQSNKWYHVVGIKDSLNISIYVDGVLKASSPNTTNVDDANLPLIIGGDDASGRFDGTIDDVRIYNRALSATEILEIYNGDMGGSPTYQCSDSVDNDGDGLADYPNDPGCTSTTDNDETDPVSDTTPPVLSEGSPTGTLSAGTTTVTLSVTTDETATCKYGTAVDTAYASIASTFTTTGSTEHSSTIAGLTDNTSHTYYISDNDVIFKDGFDNTSHTYYIRCEDSSVNANTLDYLVSFSVDTPAASDNTAPSIPTNLSATAISSSRINLSWTASTDNVAVTGYKIYRDGTQIDTIAGTSYSNTSLTAEISYSYTVSAYDAAGNESSQSTSSGAVTPEAMVVPMSKSNFKYLGAFRVPKGSFDGSSFGSNSFVNAQYQPLTYNPYNHSLFLGRATAQATSPKKIGEISIPEIIAPADVNYDISKLNVATVIQAPLDISEGKFDMLRLNGNIPSDEAKGQLGGLLVFDGKLFGTAWSYYDASGSLGYRSHWTANLDWSSGINFSGLHAVGISPTGSFANGGFVGGYMAEIPDYFKGPFGYDLVTGRVGGPIVGRSSYGPTLWGFAHDQLNFDTPAPAEMFVGYTSEHQTLGGYSDTPSLTYNRAAGVKGVVWPKSSSSIFFFGGLGLGIAHDVTGFPLNNPDPSCTGAGTSNRDEVKTNTWLQSNSPTQWTCGYIELNTSDIASGDSCCFDPIDPSYGEHVTPFVIGAGESCYGMGTRDHTNARTNEWLINNSPGNYTCGSSTITRSDIESGNACCFVGTQSTDKGGAAYPAVYQVWQYEAEDLLLVKNGIKKPWDLIPVVWNFDLPFDNPVKGKQILGAAYNSAADEVYIAQSFSDGNHPIIHVFEIISVAAPDPKPVVRPK